MQSVKKKEKCTSLGVLWLFASVSFIVPKPKHIEIFLGQIKVSNLKKKKKTFEWSINCCRSIEGPPRDWRHYYVALNRIRWALSTKWVLKPRFEILPVGKNGWNKSRKEWTLQRLQQNDFYIRTEYFVRINEGNR